MSIAFGVDDGFHFHRFERQEFLAFGDMGTWGDDDADDHSWHGSGHVGWVGRIGFDAFCGFGFDRFVDDFDFSRLSVEFEEDGSDAVWARFTDG